MSRPAPKSLVHVVSLTVALCACAAAVAEDEDTELQQVRQTVSDMFDMIEPEHVNHSPVDGWYTIQKGSIVAYISADGRYLLQGDLIDLNHQVNLSEEARNESRRELLASVTDDQTIVFAPPDVKYRVTVFTDVECTYCRRLHSQIKEYMAEGIEVRYLLYPRSGPASRSWNTSEEVWCSPDRQNALTMAKLDRKFETSKCDASIVQHHYLMGQDVGLAGTPAILLDDGTLIAGYVPPQQLKAQLELHAAK
jgi:thiol:disulfide interchange protein DsbC